MNKINFKKLFTIVLTTVFVFCIIAGLVSWLLLKNVQKDTMNNDANILGDDELAALGNLNEPGKNNDTQKQTDVIKGSIEGQISVRQINNMIYQQKYTLMKSGIYNKQKVNNFLKENISSIIPYGCYIVAYKLEDLDSDGFYEVAVMYEKRVNQNSYLMVSALRWKDGQIVKDYDETMRVNDYDNNVEIIAGDIIPGNNAEFSFIQKDITGKNGSKLKILELYPDGFRKVSDIDAGYEIEIQDYDGDGGLELYTSSISAAGVKNMTWSKWVSTDFVGYQTTQEMPENQNNTENDSLLQQNSLQQK
jgi:hypothetical protein